LSHLISPKTAKRHIHGNGECAFLDVREHGQYGEGHPFLSVNCPYSNFEQMVNRLVPRKTVKVILLDNDDGIADKASSLMSAMGYESISIIAGGAVAWKEAGFTLYKGVNLPSKTLGELIEHHEHPSLISPKTLSEWRSSSKKFYLFDCRPPNEFEKMTIPGAMCIPNGELAHRLNVLISDAQMPIVLTCAGRTRGLIGAAGLNRLGLPNPIFAVENGTQGWALSGLDLSRGNGRPVMPELDSDSLVQSKVRAEELLQREKIRCISPIEFNELACDKNRTLYLLDVRSLSEYQAGHLPGSVHCWSGQVAQALDQFIGVRRARIVLSDDTGMRAALAAIWLRAMQYEVYVIRDSDPKALHSNWRQGAPFQMKVQELRELSPTETYALCEDKGAQILDLRNSQKYRAGHIKGAVWANRARLSLIDKNRPMILFAENSIVANHIAIDIKKAGVEVFGIIKGSIEDCEQAGYELENSPNSPTDKECIDFLFFVHDRHDGNLESARRYLEWEKGLLAQLDPEERSSFSLP
jgi:rhodanese-related sulfurtransferase